MFRKYEKTPHIDAPGKFRMSRDDIRLLLAGEVVVEEKMDGANVGVIRHKQGFHLQKRGSLVGESEHEQFSYFHNWARQHNRDRLMSLPIGTVVYAELLYAVHTIFYDRLPSYVLVFDVWDGKRWLDFDKQIDFCTKYGLHRVPFIARGNFRKEELFKLVPKCSAYGDVCEGVVVKRYARRDYLRGKIVRPEFRKTMDEADEHWSRSLIRRNRLEPRQ